MPSKKVHVRSYRVKAHDRTLHTRVYKFICAACNQKVERETYATVCPTYCNKCKGSKAKRNRLTKSL